MEEGNNQFGQTQRMIVEMQGDVRQLKSQVERMSDMMEKIVAMEQRQIQSGDALNRAFTAIETVDKKVDAQNNRYDDLKNEVTGYINKGRGAWVVIGTVASMFGGIMLMASTWMIGEIFDMRDRMIRQDMMMTEHLKRAEEVERTRP